MAKGKTRISVANEAKFPHRYCEQNWLQMPTVTSCAKGLYDNVWIS